MKTFLLIALVGAAVCGWGVQGSASGFAAATSDSVGIHGTEVPFPFGTEIPFPWTTIEGAWEVKNHELCAYFNFEVRRDLNGKKVLAVTHIDQTTGRVIGTGAGFADGNEKVVRAVMHGAQNNYLIFVRVFRDLPSGGQSFSTTTVLTTRYFGGTNHDEQHYVLRKVSGTPIQIR